MSIADLYGKQLDAGLAERLRNPGPAPEAPSFEAWSFLKAGAKGVPAAGLETGGTLADMASAAATTYASTFSGGMFGGMTPQQRTDTEKARTVMLEGDIDLSAGTALRRRATEFGPDPQTAHTADQVIHGLTRVITKAVGDVMLMGPAAGGAALAIDE